MGCRNLLSGPNSNHRLETSINTALVFLTGLAGQSSQRRNPPLSQGQTGQNGGFTVELNILSQGQVPGLSQGPVCPRQHRLAQNVYVYSVPCSNLWYSWKDCFLGKVQETCSGHVIWSCFLMQPASRLTIRNRQLTVVSWSWELSAPTQIARISHKSRQKGAQIALSNRAICDLSPLSDRNRIAAPTPSNR